MKKTPEEKLSEALVKPIRIRCTECGKFVKNPTFFNFKPFHCECLPEFRE